MRSFFPELLSSRIFGFMHSDLDHHSAPAQAIATVVEVDRISRRNPKSDGWLIKDVSLTLAGGDRLGLVGPSGAGKTVLLRALALLDPLDYGTILWQGRAECGEGVPRYRKRVIYLHQRPALFEGTVEDNLRHAVRRSAAHRRPGIRPGAGSRIFWRGWAATTSSSPRRAGDLSGGEAQLVGLSAPCSSTRPCSCWTSRPLRSTRPRPPPSRACSNEWLAAARRAGARLGQPRRRAGRAHDRRETLSSPGRMNRAGAALR